MSSTTTLSPGAVRELERDIRRQILAIDNPAIEDALFSMLALVVDIRQKVEASPHAQ
jgi:hypothetical protein